MWADFQQGGVALISHRRLRMDYQSSARPLTVYYLKASKRSFWVNRTRQRPLFHPLLPKVIALVGSMFVLVQCLIQIGIFDQAKPLLDGARVQTSKIVHEVQDALHAAQREFQTQRKPNPLILVDVPRSSDNWRIRSTSSDEGFLSLLSFALPLTRWKAFSVKSLLRALSRENRIRKQPAIAQLQVRVTLPVKLTISRVKSISPSCSSC